MSSIASYGVFTPPNEKMSIGKTAIKLALALIAAATSFWAMVRCCAELGKAVVFRLGKLERDAIRRDEKIEKLFALVREKDRQIAELERLIADLRKQNVGQQNQLEGQQKQLDELNNRLVIVTRERDEAIAKLNAQGQP